MSLTKLIRALAVLIHPATARTPHPPATHGIDPADYERRMIKLYLAHIGGHGEAAEKPPAQPHSQTPFYWQIKGGLSAG